MPVFINKQKETVIYTSYKVGYSTLKILGSENGLEYLGHEVNWRVYQKLLKVKSFKRYQLIRDPYKRYVSFFKDKLMIQPTKIIEWKAQMQPIHHLILDYLKVNKHYGQKIKAQALLSIDINDFTNQLPKIYLQDGHLQPQKKSSSLKVTNFMYWPLRVDGHLCIQRDQKLISEVTGIDFETKRNYTNSADLVDELSSKSIKVLNSLYKKDFSMGNYQFK